MTRTNDQMYDEFTKHNPDRTKAYRTSYPKHTGKFTIIKESSS